MRKISSLPNLDNDGINHHHHIREHQQQQQGQSSSLSSSSSSSSSSSLLLCNNKSKKKYTTVMMGLMVIAIVCFSFSVSNTLTSLNVMHNMFSSSSSSSSSAAAAGSTITSEEEEEDNNNVKNHKKNKNNNILNEAQASLKLVGSKYNNNNMIRHQKGNKMNNNKMNNNNNNKYFAQSISKRKVVLNANDDDFKEEELEKEKNRFFNNNDNDNDNEMNNNNDKSELIIITGTHVKILKRDEYNDRETEICHLLSNALLKYWSTLSPIDHQIALSQVKLNLNMLSKMKTKCIVHQSTPTGHRLPPIPLSIPVLSFENSLYNNQTQQTSTSTSTISSLEKQEKTRKTMISQGFIQPDLLSLERIVTRVGINLKIYSLIDDSLKDMTMFDYSNELSIQRSEEPDLYWKKTLRLSLSNLFIQAKQMTERTEMSFFYYKCVQHKVNPGFSSSSSSSSSENKDVDSDSDKFSLNNISANEFVTVLENEINKNKKQISGSCVFESSRRHHDEIPYWEYPTNPTWLLPSDHTNTMKKNYKKYPSIEEFSLTKEEKKLIPPRIVFFAGIEGIGHHMFTKLLDYFEAITYDDYICKHAEKLFSIDNDGEYEHHAKLIYQRFKLLKPGKIYLANIGNKEHQMSYPFGARYMTTRNTCKFKLPSRMQCITNPDIFSLSKIADHAGVQFNTVVVFRSMGASVVSTTKHRSFGGEVLVQSRILAASWNQLSADLMTQPKDSYEVLSYDETLTRPVMSANLIHRLFLFDNPTRIHLCHNFVENALQLSHKAGYDWRPELKAPEHIQIVEQVHANAPDLYSLNENNFQLVKYKYANTAAAVVGSSQKKSYEMTEIATYDYLKHLMKDSYMTDYVPFCDFKAIRPYTNPPVVRSEKSKWAIVSLIRGHEDFSGYDELRERNQLLYKYLDEIGRVNDIDVILFHEGDVTKAAQKMLQKDAGNRNIIFKDVGYLFGSSFYDEMFDKFGYQDLNNEYNANIPNDNVNIGYKAMCFFWSFEVFKLLDDYDYYLRLDDDGYLLNANINIFEYTENNNLEYGYVGKRYDPHMNTSLTFPAFAVNYMESCDINSISMKGVFAGIDEQNYYNNFHVTKLSFWHRPEVQLFLMNIMRSKGIWMYRWGDSPIQAVTVKMFMNADSIHQIPGIVYKHGSHNKLIDSNTATYVEFYTESEEIKKLKMSNTYKYQMGFS